METPADKINVPDVTFHQAVRTRLKELELLGHTTGVESREAVANTIIEAVVDIVKKGESPRLAMLPYQWPDDYPRDFWIYYEMSRGGVKADDFILQLEQKISREKPYWTPIGTRPGIIKVAKRFAHHHNLPEVHFQGKAYT